MAWDALRNARDLGGVPTPAGPTRSNAFLRSDRLSLLTAVGRAALLAAGVSTVVDLRAPCELVRDPSPLRGWRGYRSLPLIDDPGLIASAEAAERGEQLGYIRYVEQYGAGLAEIYKGLASAPPGSVLFHCHAGKDRTGMVAALLLLLAGAPRTAVLDDYLIIDDGVPEAHRPRRAMMEEVLDFVDHTHGGPPGLLSSLGLSSGQIAGLRARLAP